LIGGNAADLGRRAADITSREIIAFPLTTGGSVDLVLVIARNRARAPFGGDDLAATCHLVRAGAVGLERFPSSPLPGQRI
jgi:hypothetical protein